MGPRVWLTVGVMVLAVAAVRADPVEDEAKKLQGTWVVQSATVGGKRMDSLKTAQMVFTGTKLTMKSADGKEDRFTYKVDPSRKPKTMDFVPEKKKAKAKVGVAIYKLEGDTLTLCLGPADMRPKEFTDKGGPMVVLKRKK